MLSYAAFVALIVTVGATGVTTKPPSGAAGIPIVRAPSFDGAEPAQPQSCYRVEFRTGCDGGCEDRDRRSCPPTSDPEVHGTDSAGETLASSDITIGKNATPADGTDFGFGSHMGAFALDDAVPDDGDGIGDSKDFLVTAGQSRDVIEYVPTFWRLSSIVCTHGPAGTSVSSIRVGTRLIGVSTIAASGDDVTCTFNNEKSVASRLYLPMVSKGSAPLVRQR